jgi:hypothetical protein
MSWARDDSTTDALFDGCSALGVRGAGLKNVPPPSATATAYDCKAQKSWSQLVTAQTPSSRFAITCPCKPLAAEDNFPSGSTHLPYVRAGGIYAASASPSGACHALTLLRADYLNE